MTENTLHLRKDGKTEYIDLNRLNITKDSTDAEIKHEVERYMDFNQNELVQYVVERLENNISIRPAAVYG